LNLTPPSIGQPNATEDVDIVNAFSAIQTLVNGNLDEQNLATATNQRLGLNSGGASGRGTTGLITASETRINAAYGLLGTPDQVSGIVLPTNGLLVIGYQAAWSESVAAAARAAIFIGATQLKFVSGAGAAPAVQEAGTQSGGTTGTSIALGTGPRGIISEVAAAGYPGDVTTGQVLGVGQGSDGVGGRVGYGPTYVWAAAGTYTVSVQFKASSGSVTAVNRRLWVWSIGF
jgi:hypothetical protein